LTVVGLTASFPGQLPLLVAHHAGMGTMGIMCRGNA